MAKPFQMALLLDIDATTSHAITITAPQRNIVSATS
jgi:hypothetical protein